MKHVELRRLQMTGGASYTVSLPKDWVREQGLKAGDVVAVLPRSDSLLTLVSHEKIPTTQGKGAEIALTPTKDQDREQILRTGVAQHLGGYDMIRIRLPTPSRPDLRTYLSEVARRTIVAAELIAE